MTLRCLTFTCNCTQVLVVGYLVLVSALHMHNTNTVNEDADWQYGEAIYYSVMTFTTIGLGDRVVHRRSTRAAPQGDCFARVSLHEGVAD